MRKTALGLAAFGLLVALAGLTFALQGMGVVGPEGSFMFRSSTWITQGALTIVVGLVLIIGAVALERQAKPAART